MRREDVEKYHKECSAYGRCFLVYVGIKKPPNWWQEVFFGPIVWVYWGGVSVPEGGGVGDFRGELGGVDGEGDEDVFVNLEEGVVGVEKWFWGVFQFVGVELVDGEECEEGGLVDTYLGNGRDFVEGGVEVLGGDESPEGVGTGTGAAVDSSGEAGLE